MNATNELLSPPVAPPAAPALNLRWLLVSAVILPAAIAGADYVMLNRIVNLQKATPEICLAFSWYVVQVGMVGYVVGRGKAPPFLRWVVFGWVLLLVNLLTATQAMNPTAWEPSVHLPPAALFAGQMGLCVVWAIFGDTSWALRWPGMILLAFSIFSLWVAFGNQYSREMWTELLIIQVVTLAALCGLLRWRGFRLRRIEAAPAQGAADAEQRRLQFNIKHVLIWTTALAMLLGLGKALDLLTWEAARQLVRAGILWKLTVATASAIVIVVALWVALGRGHWLMRLGVGLLFTLAVGSGLAVWSLHNAATLSGRIWGMWQAGDYDLHRWYEIGWWWLGWFFLSGGLLAATLIVLRTRDYRLVRKAPRIVPRPIASFQE